MHAHRVVADVVVAGRRTLYRERVAAWLATETAGAVRCVATPAELDAAGPETPFVLAILEHDDVDTLKAYAMRTNVSRLVLVAILPTRRLRAAARGLGVTLFDALDPAAILLDRVAEAVRGRSANVAS